jgi:hypothetical protein
MAWFDELDEQTQRQWRSRLEKGRIELSASVEQTLAEGVAEEEWLDGDDEEEGGGQVGDGQRGEERRATAVIPPRLSLQTKPMYTVASQVSGAVPAADQSQVPAVQTGGMQERPPAQEKQQGGVFSRLAQRVTMSLAAITLPFQGHAPAAPSAQSPAPPAAQETCIPMPGLLASPNLSMQTVTTVRVEHSETTTTTTIIDASAMHHPLPAPVLPPIPQLPRNATATAQEEGKARPAGYPTKVHLEAAPKGTSLHGVGGQSENRQKGAGSYPPHDSTEPLALSNTFSIPRSEPTFELPVVDERQAAPAEAAPGSEAIYEKTTSGRLPSVRTLERGAALASWQPLFGSGCFDAGQGDAAIACSQITAASVVTVMLASDPGPVVVQYISLQPGIGFTVHLSAPTKVKTSFNYAVLQPGGEA